MAMLVLLREITDGEKQQLADHLLNFGFGPDEVMIVLKDQESRDKYPCVIGRFIKPSMRFMMKCDYKDDLYFKGFPGYCEVKDDDKPIFTGPAIII